jgi:vacuolar-type H+-ATPase subunit E/Vma4
MMDTVNQKLNTDSEKLEHFVKAVNNEIQKTISGIIGEAEASKKAVLESAVVESNRLANDKINENVKKVNSKYVRIVAKAELDCKIDVLIEREKLTYKVFENIKESLIAFRQKPQYLKYLISLVKSEEIKDGLTICLSSEDMKYSADIQKALGNTCEFKEDSSIKLGGLSLLYADQGILIDKTIDSALSEQKNFFNEKNCFSQS